MESLKEYFHGLNNWIDTGNTINGVNTENGKNIENWEYSFVTSFIIGIVFSGISYGILYILFFLIISEFLYYIYLDCNDLNYYKERILVCLGGILGYMLGAAFLHNSDDYHLQIWNFPSQITEFGRKCGFFDNDKHMKYLQKCKEKECPYHNIIHERSRKRDHLNCKTKCVLPLQCHIYRGENCKFYNKNDWK